MGNGSEKIWQAVGTKRERKDNPSLVPNYRMIRSSVQTLHYPIVVTQPDGTTKVEDYKLSEAEKEKYLIKGKDPKKRNIYTYTSNVATPDIVRTDPKDYADPLDPARVEAFGRNVSALCAAIKEYDSSTHVMKDGKKAKRIVTIGAEADGKTPLDIISLMETGIMDALKLRGQKQCYKLNLPRAKDAVAKLLGQTLSTKAPKREEEEEVDEDWEADIDEDVA